MESKATKINSYAQKRIVPNADSVSFFALPSIVSSFVAMPYFNTSAQLVLEIPVYSTGDVLVIKLLIQCLMDSYKYNSANIPMFTCDV